MVCLQELKCEDRIFPVAKITQAGYHAAWQGEKSRNGVAVLSKNEIKELRRDLSGKEDEFFIAVTCKFLSPV